jgi:hypothetical protein
MKTILQISAVLALAAGCGSLTITENKPPAKNPQDLGARASSKHTKPLASKSAE